MAKNEAAIIPPKFVLTPEEDKLMDLIVGHMVDFYFSSPKEFLRPVLQRPPKRDNLRGSK